MPPCGEVVLKIWFYSELPGAFAQTFNFELMGTRRLYQLPCRGICTHPSICRNYMSVCIAAMATTMLMFGADCQFYCLRLQKEQRCFNKTVVLHRSYIFYTSSNYMNEYIYTKTLFGPCIESHYRLLFGQLVYRVFFPRTLFPTCKKVETMSGKLQKAYVTDPGYFEFGPLLCSKTRDR